jgi:hypothetical protein
VDLVIYLEKIIFVIHLENVKSVYKIVQAENVDLLLADVEILVEIVLYFTTQAILAIY